MERKRKIVPPVYLLLTLLAMAAMHFFLPIVRVIAAPYTQLGWVFVAVGVGIVAVAAGAFRRAGTPVIPFEPSTALVTGGLYRFTRNPMYLGMVLLLIGVAILLGSLTAFLPVPVFAWIIQKWFIEGEERFLEEIFGENYLAFKRNVRRWL